MLNFVELFVFSNVGQDLAAGSLGAIASFSTGIAYSVGGATQTASYGNDLLTDPYLAMAANPPAGAIAGTVSGPASWALQFAGARPAPVSSVVLINRVDGGTNARMNATSPGTLTLVAADGAVVASRAVSSLSVSVWNFLDTAQRGPLYPAVNDSFQASAANQFKYARYVRVAAAPGQCLAFRELYALDDTFTNVALYK